MSSEQSGRHFKGALLLLATAFVLLLSMGWWGGSQYAARLDGEKRVRLLRHAADIAGYIKPDLIKELSFTVADGGTPVFERLREQLINEAKMIPSARWVYSMADLDGLIVFGPESTPLDDPQYSPPGTSYHNPPKELLIAFKQKRLVTAGPYTDEWGTFISAFAPVLDPYSGRVLMVIGIDIKADDWQAAINAGWQLPYMVTLVLLLVLLLAVGWYINRIKLDILRLRHWIIAVAAMPMLAGLALNGAYEYWELKETSSRTILLTTEHVQSSWNRMVASHVQLMEVQSHQIASTQKILKAWQQRDLPALTALAQPVFEQLKLEYGITHFNFITPENTCFLRMHKPELPADIMERGARLPAQSTAGDFWGIDLDPAGDCALRYAMPWKQDGKVIGYLELGIEIAHLTRQLSAEMNLDLLAVIRKEYITRNKFEAGRRMFGFAGQWDDYPDFVVTQQTGQYMLQEAAAWIKQHPRTGTEDDIFNVKQGKEHFACSLIRLPDAAGREVAYIILMLNVTAEVDAAWSNLLLNIGLAVTVCGGVLILLWSIFGMAERRLTATIAETKESDDNFRNFFESVTDMIMVSTPAGQLLYSNAAVSRTLGYTRDELGRMHLLDLCPADKRPESRKFYQSNLKGNWENGLLLARRDGGIVPAETRVWPGRWSGADCIFSISKDLTGVQEEQQRFELLFRNNPALIAISTLPDQRFADINDAFLKVLGYSRGDVIGKTAAGLGLFEYPQLQAAAADTLSADRYISNVEMQVRRRDGTILDGLFSGDVFSIHGKQYSMTVMIDITERKRAADALQSQSSLQQLLMEIGTQYINLPLDDVEAAINTSMIKLAEFVRADRAYTFAYDFDQQICINTREWCAAGITPQINELQAVPLAAVPDWVKAHQCGESIYVPDVLSLPSGGLRDILEPQGIKSLLAVPLMSRNECIGFVGFDSVLQHHNYSDKEQDLLLVFAQMLVNVEQRKQSEEARRVSEERLEQLAEQSRTIAWEVNLQGLYTYISRAAGPVLGYMPAEIIGKLHFYDLHPESGRDEFKLAAFAGFERKEPFHDLINQVQAKDGRQLWVATNGIPLLNADGTLRGYRGSDTDITERQLAEAELIKAKGHAEESDRLKTAFLNNISHEIRTPLNGILGFLSLLEDDTLSAGKKSEYAGMINQSADRLMNIISDTIEMSKIQTGQVKINLVETDINRLSRDLFEQFKQQAETKGLNFTLKNSLSSAYYSIKTDDDKLNSVLGILINNAIKFTQTGSVELEITRNETFLEFSVKDTGPGIPENKRQRIFECFMQADVSNTRKFEGAGLGLAIAQAHVKMLGGDIRFESKEGQGTTFYVTLPYQLIEPGKVCDPRPETPEVVMHAQQFLKILVAEDDEINFDYVNAILTKANYVVLHAWTGVEAVELCRKHADIDIILMDIKMPVMDGYIATSSLSDFFFKGHIA